MEPKFGIRDIVAMPFMLFGAFMMKFGVRVGGDWTASILKSRKGKDYA